MRNTKRDLALIVTLAQLIKNVLLKTQEIRKENRTRKFLSFFFCFYTQDDSLWKWHHMSPDGVRFGMRVKSGALVISSSGYVDHVFATTLHLWV